MVMHINRLQLLDLLPKESVCAEVGSHDGNFTKHIIPRIKPKKIYLIDTWRFWDHKIYGKRYKSLEYIGAGHGNVCDAPKQEVIYNKLLNKFPRQIANGTAEIMRMTSIQALNQFDNDYLDWIYLDGCHLYETVIAELFCSHRVVKPGGFIGGHDHTNIGLWEDGATIAVAEFLDTGMCEAIALGDQPNTPNCIDYLLRVVK